MCPLLTAHWHRSSCALVTRFRSFQLPKMKLKFKSCYFDTLEFFCLFLFSCSLPKEVKSNTWWAIFVKFADKTGTASLPSSDDPAVGDFTEWVSCPSWTRMHQKLKRWRLYSRVNTFPLLSFRWMLSKEKLTNTCTFIASFVVVMSAEPLSLFYSHFLDSGWSGGTSH